MHSANYERSVQKVENPADAAMHNIVTLYSQKDAECGTTTISIDRAETQSGQVAERNGGRSGQKRFRAGN
jgi:hypothetical protein